MNVMPNHSIRPNFFFQIFVSYRELMYQLSIDRIESIWLDFWLFKRVLYTLKVIDRLFIEINELIAMSTALMASTLVFIKHKILEKWATRSVKTT